MSTTLEATINEAFENRDSLSPSNAPADIVDAVEQAIAMLDSGQARVAEPTGDHQWKVNEWLKKAVLLSFRLRDNKPIAAGGFTQFYDKVPGKFTDMTEAQFAESGVRVVPPAMARKGSYIANNTVLMPSYVNIGAYVDSGTMVDTWATVGSCAQIGKMYTYQAALALAAFLNRFKPHPPSLKIIALSVLVPKWLKALSLKKVQLFRWVYTLVKARASMIARRMKSATAAYQQALLLYQATYPQATVSTACTAPLS